MIQSIENPKKLSINEYKIQIKNYVPKKRLLTQSARFKKDLQYEKFYNEAVFAYIIMLNKCKTYKFYSPSFSRCTWEKNRLVFLR